MDASTALRLDDPALKQRNARKLLECVNKLQINIMNPPRKGKKLMVLDLDYTILVSQAAAVVPRDFTLTVRFVVFRTVSSRGRS